MIITGHNLEFNEIETELQLNASKKVKEGDIISKIMGPNEFDAIVFDECFENENQIDSAMNKLMDSISPKKSFLTNLAKRNNVRIRFYLQSHSAQIYMLFEPSTMKKIAETGLKVEFSILSWGGAEID